MLLASVRRTATVAGRARIGILVVLALASATTLAGGTQAATRDCPDQDLLVTAANGPKIRAAVRCLINQQRKAHGLGNLAANHDLRVAGERYSRLMVSEHFFSHVSPGGSTVQSRISRTAYLHHAANWELGENLGFGVGSDATPSKLIVAWMASPVHRAHILKGSYRDVGIGVATGLPSRDAGGGATFSVEFGRRTLRK